MKNTERTVREWLNMLPEPYRSEAFKNEIKQPDKILGYKDLWYCGNSFDFGKSIQGLHYWWELQMNISNGTITLTEPEAEKEFVWDERLVEECLLFDLESDHSNVKEVIEQFKASKQRKVLFVVFTKIGFGYPDWEVVEGFGVRGLNWNNTVKDFSTREAAQQYITDHQPRYSLKDVRESATIATKHLDKRIIDDIISELKNKKG